MKLEELQKFCSTEERHKQDGIDKPFTRGDWTYATEGHICIRIPCISEVINQSGPGNVEKLFADALGRETKWQPLPEFELEYVTCSTCGGTGHVCLCPLSDTEKCKWGDGIECRDYDDDCLKGCNNKAKGAIQCEDCGGLGAIELSGNHIIQGVTGPVRISAIFMDMIKDLPNVQISPYGEKIPIRIRFDGGEGLLMGMLL